MVDYGIQDHVSQVGRSLGSQASLAGYDSLPYRLKQVIRFLLERDNNIIEDQQADLLNHDEHGSVDDENHVQRPTLPLLQGINSTAVVATSTHFRSSCISTNKITVARVLRCDTPNVAFIVESEHFSAERHLAAQC